MSRIAAAIHCTAEDRKELERLSKSRPDDISLLDAKKLDAPRIFSSAQVTDSYLLALACTHGGKLATFDRRLVMDAVRGGANGLHLIG